ncbi:MAG: hypothetical protein E7362_00215 [Clostridiales bacterium]|nr:hypothetical protein [Clostridiales bacterium]
MEISFLNVLITVFALVLLAVPGFVLVKTKILSPKADAPISALVLYGCQPVMVFMSFQKTAFTPEIAMNMLIVAGLAFAVQLVMVGLMYLIIRNKSNDAKLNCVRFASVFSNCGYMGLPFLQALFSGGAFMGEIVIYGGIVIATFNILMWSIGIYMITGDKKQMSIKKAVLNPTVIGLILGIVVFLAVQTPLINLVQEGTTEYLLVSKIVQSLNFVSDTVTPLSMIVVGIKLAGVNLKELFLDKWSYVACGCKLVLMSLIAMLIVAFLPISVVAKYAVFFCLSMPSATGTVMFAVNFGGDGKSASVIVLLTTVLSIITIPLMYLMFSGVFGVVI